MDSNFSLLDLVADLKAYREADQKEKRRLKSATKMAFEQLAACSNENKDLRETSKKAVNELKAKLRQAERDLLKQTVYTGKVRLEREEARRDVVKLQEQIEAVKKERDDERAMRTKDREDLHRARATINAIFDPLITNEATPKNPSSDTDPAPTASSKHLVGTESGTTIQSAIDLTAGTSTRRPTDTNDRSRTQQPGRTSTSAASPEQIQTASSSSHEKTNATAKRRQPSAEGIDSAKRLLQGLIFATNGRELEFQDFSEDIQTNFASALAPVMDDHRTNVDAFKQKPYRKNCLSCTSGHRSCDFKEDDFACEWCESNAQLCVLRTEGKCYVLSRVQGETQDSTNERYWLAGQRLKKRRTGAQLLS